MKRVFLLAHPAGHSLSPALHNAAFAATGLKAHYEARDVAPEDLAEAVAALRAPDVLGANVTIPHKPAVLPLMDTLTVTAEAIGAVNTIVNREGELLGHNTDAAGFLRALQEDAGLELSGTTALLLGAGGAARAVVYALLSAGVERVQIYNRTVDKARALAADFGALGRVEVLSEQALPKAVRQTQLLVNTTSVGMERGGVNPDVSPLPEGVLPQNGFVCDLVYRPEHTRLLQDAAAAGLLTQNGLPMLVYQGAAAFQRWTKCAAPLEVMMTAARGALAHSPSRASKSG
ncbi:shikimate dehydrogenase [soil metagenome]